MTAPRATELQCQATIVAAALRLGWLVHAERAAQHRSGRWGTPIQGTPGFPDLILVHPVSRWFLAVELKRKPNKVEPSQQHWLDAIQGSGNVAQVVRVPEQVDEFIGRLSTLSRDAAGLGRGSHAH